jgi:glutathione S-transferase
MPVQRSDNSDDAAAAMAALAERNPNPVLTPLEHAHKALTQAGDLLRAVVGARRSHEMQALRERIHTTRIEIDRALTKLETGLRGPTRAAQPGAGPTPEHSS